MRERTRKVKSWRQLHAEGLKPELNPASMGCLPEGANVTICLSAICEKGEAVVFATDKLLTAAGFAVEFEHPGGKSTRIGPNCVGLSAGDALYDTELFGAAQGAIGQFHAPTVEQVATTVRDLFRDLRLKRAEEYVLRPRGLDLASFYENLMGRLPPELAFQIDEGIRSAKLPLQVMLAGLDSSGAHIYGIEDPGSLDCWDRLGYHAVGSGETHALLTLIAREHSIDNTLNQTAYLVYEAKRKAEVAPGVGRETEMGFMSREQGLYLLQKDELDALESAYQQTLAPQREALQAAVQAMTFGRKGNGT